MTKLLLAIYDFLEKRRWLTIAILVLFSTVFAFMAWRINYEEDISKFLPNNDRHRELGKSLEELTARNTIAVLFSGKDSTDTERIIEVMDAFAETVEEEDIAENVFATVDQTQAFDLVEAVYEHIPYLLNEEDYLRIDSLIQTPGFIGRQLREDKKTLMLPTAGAFTNSIAHDPLRLFSPALKKLQTLNANSSVRIVDDHMFTSDGKYGIVTFETPYGANESGNNTLLAKRVNGILADLQKENPDIEITAVGAPLIAVSNAARIKKDSMLAVAIAAALIFLILILHYRRLSDILWVGVSILFGVLFALAGMSLLNDSTSIIVLGIGSVIIGIAANYPLHFLDEYKETGDRREALKEMAMPLLTGNLTTVAAFLCLVWLDAQAMRDLGVFGALALLGTIVFVLVFLPHLAKRRPSPSASRIFGKISDIHLSRSKAKPYIAVSIAILTIILGYFSTKTSFDSDLSHINYMTGQQREGMKVLSQIQPTDAVYAISQGDDLKSAVENNNTLVRKIREADPGAVVSGLGEFLPDEKAMREAADRWNNFWQDESRKEFLRRFELEAGSEGFAVTAFHPFTTLVSEECGVAEAEEFNDFVQPFLDKYVFLGDDGCKIVNYVHTGNKAALHERIGFTSNDYYTFSNDDIGNRLVSMLRESFDFVGLVCGVVVFIFLLVSFRKIEIALIAFLPLAVAWLWILGLMHLCGIQFNIVNIILATFIFGQGDDYTIFITEGLLYENTTGKPRLAAYKHSVFISAAIMFAGIGCLIVAKHPALRSLATVTIIGMFTVVLLTSFLPAFVFDFLTMKNGKRRFAPITLKRLVYSLPYGAAFAITVMFIVQPYTLLHFLFRRDSEATKEKYHRMLQRFARFFANHAPGIKFTLKNEHGESFDKPAVIICNHQSHLDILYILSLSPKIVFLTNDWVWKNPLYGLVIRKAECYPVSNGFDENLPKLRDLHERGYSICIFPEGTRSPDCRIMRFHKGAFALARSLDADILPLYIHGAGHVLPKEEVLMCEGSALLEVGERRKLQTEGENGTEHDPDLIAAKNMRHHYIEHYSELCKEVETDEHNRIAEYYRNYYTIKS